MSYLIIRELKIGFCVHLDSGYDYDAELRAMKRIFTEESFILTDFNIDSLSLQDYIDIGINVDAINIISSEEFADELALLYFFDNRGLTWELFEEGSLPEKFKNYIKN